MPADAQHLAAHGQDPPRLAHPAPADPAPADPAPANAVPTVLTLGGCPEDPDPEWDDPGERDGFIPAEPSPLRAIRAAFAQDQPADSMLPGAVLTALAEQVWQHGLAGLDDDQLTGMLQAANRLAAWTAALRLAAVSQLAGRRTAACAASGDRRPLEHTRDELAITLTLTGWGADRLLGLATALDRLPLTQSALASGTIDERRADVIADELGGLDDEHAAKVEAQLLPRAASQTTAQLRQAARRAVIAVDPAAAKRRKDKALNDARVETFTEAAGTAALAGRDLPPAAVLAADKTLTSLAVGLQQAGAAGTLDQLRAHAYLHLLSGQPAGTLTSPAPGAPGAASPGMPAPIPARPAAPTVAPSASGQPSPAQPPPSAPGQRSPAQPPPATGPGAGLPVMRGSIHLTLPLATWLGLSQAPGQADGFGPLDADDSRAIAAVLAAHPTTTWCISLTNPAGQPVAHGCARAGPRPPPSPDEPGTASVPDQVALAGWIRDMKIAPLQTGNCTHPREGRGYQPGPGLRHLIQIRNATCTAPGCRRPAQRSDQDHTIPYHDGGRTCECNLGPLCRRHHKCKQLPGWTLTQLTPGTFTWTTPSGRGYQTTPTEYPG